MGPYRLFLFPQLQHLIQDRLGQLRLLLQRAFDRSLAGQEGCDVRIHVEACAGLGDVVGHDHVQVLLVQLAGCVFHQVLGFRSEAHQRLAELADVCGIEGANRAEKANNFIKWIEETNAKMGLPDGFDMIKDEDIDQMIRWARKEANPLYPVPVIWAPGDFRRLIQTVRK